MYLTSPIFNSSSKSTGYFICRWGSTIKSLWLFLNDFFSPSFLSPSKNLLCFELYKRKQKLEQPTGEKKLLSSLIYTKNRVSIRSSERSRRIFCKKTVKVLFFLQWVCKWIFFSLSPQSFWPFIIFKPRFTSYHAVTHFYINVFPYSGRTVLQYYRVEYKLDYYITVVQRKNWLLIVALWLPIHRERMLYTMRVMLWLIGLKSRQLINFSVYML